MAKAGRNTKINTISKTVNGVNITWDMDDEITATPRKLRTGQWGCAGNYAGLARGDIETIRVTTRAGKSWTRTYRVVWSNGRQFTAAPVAARRTRRNHYRCEDARWDAESR